MRNANILDLLLQLNEATNLIDSQFVKITKLYKELEELKVKSNSMDILLDDSIFYFNKYKSINREFLKSEIDKLKKNVI